MLDDERFVDIYRLFDRAFDWRPGDPQFEQLADDMLALFGATPGTAELDVDTSIDETVIAMLDAHSLGLSPGWRYLATLLDQRGFSGR